MGKVKLKNAEEEMVKGIYKEFITVKIKDNPLYEEAIFVLKRSPDSIAKGKKRKTRDDMTFEANRILCEQGIKKPKKRFKALKKVLFSVVFLLLGGFSGSLITFFILK